MRLRCILVLLLTSSGVAFAQGGPRYFPLDPGNTWFYTTQDNSGTAFSRWTVLERQGDTALLEQQRGGNPLRLREVGTDVEIELPGEEFVLYYRFVEDSTWVHGDIHVCDDGRLMTVHRENALVETPAGSFDDCLRVEIASASDCIDAGLMVQWWAEDVGLVKWMEVTVAGLITVELQSYSLDGDGGAMRPGDCNADGGLDIADGVCLLGHLFQGSPVQLPCGDGTVNDAGNTRVLDSNDDGMLDIADAVHVFGYLFLGGPPPAPGTDCISVVGCPLACVE